MLISDKIFSIMLHKMQILSRMKIFLTLSQFEFYLLQFLLLFTFSFTLFFISLSILDILQSPKAALGIDQQEYSGKLHLRVKHRVRH